MYRNHEGYPDPTAGEALANVRREERASKRMEGFRLAYPNAGSSIPTPTPVAPDQHKPKKKRPPRAEQRARQKANKAKGRCNEA